MWSYAGAVVRTVSQLAFGVVLARILGPQPFGLMAVAWLVIGWGYLIADFGFGAALVQMKTISENQVRFVFTIQVLIGAAMTGVTAASAGLIARVFDQPDLVLVIRVISLTFLAQTLGQTAQSLLKRDLDFRSLQGAHIFSYILAYGIVGIPLAYLGLGVWSLVIAQLSQTMLSTIFVYAKTRHPVGPLLVEPHASKLFKFGSQVVGNNLINLATQSMDTFFVGRFFGIVALGLYNRSYTLLSTPTVSFVSLLQGVLFPTYSRFQGDDTTLKRGYLASVGAITLLTLPVFFGVAVVPQTVIEGMYGERWSAAIPLLVPLAMAMPFHALMAMAGPLMYGKGRPGIELRIQAAVAVLLLLTMVLVSRFTVVMLAWSVLLIYIIRCALITSAALRLVSGSWREILTSVLGGLFLLFATVPVLFGTDRILLNQSVPPEIRLCIDVFAAAVIVILLIVRFPRLALSAELGWALARFAEGAPPFVRRLLKGLRLVEQRQFMGAKGEGET